MSPPAHRRLTPLRDPSLTETSLQLHFLFMTAKPEPEYYRRVMKDAMRQRFDASASVRWSTEAAHCPEQYVLRWAECAWAHRDRDEAVTRQTTFIQGEVKPCFKL